MAICNCIIIWCQQKFCMSVEAGSNFRMLASIDFKQRPIDST